MAKRALTVFSQYDNGARIEIETEIEIPIMNYNARLILVADWLPTVGATYRHDSVFSMGNAHQSVLYLTLRIHFRAQNLRNDIIARLI